MLLKQVPNYRVNDLNNDTSETLNRAAVDDGAKTGVKTYKTLLTYSSGDYPKAPGNDTTTELKPYISDQLDFYFNKFIKPRLESLEQRCDRLESRVSSLESENNNLKNRISTLENK